MSDAFVSALLIYLSICLWWNPLCRYTNYGFSVGVADWWPRFHGCVWLYEVKAPFTSRKGFLLVCKDVCPLACSRRSDIGVRANNIASERARKNEGRLGFGSLYFSLALHYLNAWNRLFVHYLSEILNLLVVQVRWESRCASHMPRHLG